MTEPTPGDPSTSTLAPIVAADVAGYCLRMAGPGRVELVGTELEHMKGPLLAAGCEVIMRLAPDGAGAPGMVVVWTTSAEAIFSQDLATDILVLVAPQQVEAEVTRWIEVAHQAGWALHPALFAVPGPPQGVDICAFSREGVRTEDAATLTHASYHGLAAALVRPGDAVFATDAAPYDLWQIVLQQSRCSWLGVLANSPMAAASPILAWLDESALEQLSKPLDMVITRLSGNPTCWAETLGRLAGKLVRSGRLLVDVPPATGQPEGHDVQGQLQQCGLVVDRAWKHVSNGPLGLSRFIEIGRNAAGELAMDEDPAAPAAGVVLMAVKIDGPGLARDPALQQPNLIAFQRDYIDASVVRLIVAVGLRLESAPLRRRVARSVLRESPSDSADYGAALCVLLYDPGALEADGRDHYLTDARRFIELAAANPTVLRWQVSLAFAAATLYQSSGELRQAEVLYRRVLDFDVLAFSPLLGTKTTAAAVSLGWLLFARGELEEARRVWAHGLDEARRLAAQPDWTAVVGDPAAPETFAMPELAAVIDEAGRLASALRVTRETPLRAGLAWQWANRSWRVQLQEARDERRRQQMLHDDLLAAKDWLDHQYHQLNQELALRDRVLQQKEQEHQAEPDELQNAKDWLEAQYHQLNAELDRRDDVIRELRDRQAAFDQLQESKDWLDGQYHQLKAEVALRDHALQHMEQQGWQVGRNELQEAKDWLAEQYLRLNAELASRDHVIKELQHRQFALDQLQEGKDWLDEQYHLLNKELARRGDVIAELDSTARALASDYNGAQAAFRLAHLHDAAERDALTQQISVLRAQNDQVAAEHQQLAAEHETLIADHRHLVDANQELIAAHQSLTGTYHYLVGAAQHLSLATGAIMNRRGTASEQAASVAEEMSRLAEQLNRLPLKGLIRTILRALVTAIGRK